MSPNTRTLLSAAEIVMVEVLTIFSVLAVSVIVAAAGPLLNATRGLTLVRADPSPAKAVAVRAPVFGTKLSLVVDNIAALLPAAVVHSGYMVAAFVVSSAEFTGTVIAADPSKFVPLIARAVVSVAAEPVTLPVMALVTSRSVNQPLVSLVPVTPNEPDIVILFAPIASVPPIVSPVRVPTEVIAVCAAPVTVAAVPEALPVTLPVKGPAKPVAVRIPVLSTTNLFTPPCWSLSRFPPAVSLMKMESFADASESAEAGARETPVPAPWSVAQIHAVSPGFLFMISFGPQELSATLENKMELSGIALE